MQTLRQIRADRFLRNCTLLRVLTSIPDQEPCSIPLIHAGLSAEQICKSGKLRLPGQFHRSDRAISLLGHNNFSNALLLCIRIIVIIPVDEHDDGRRRPAQWLPIHADPTASACDWASTPPRGITATEPQSAHAALWQAT